MNTNDKAAENEQGYLRDVQYAGGENLNARAALHERFGTATISLRNFLADLIDWDGITQVLECGCGTGGLWENDRAPKSLDLTLTDLSPGMVEIAIAHAKSLGFGAPGVGSVEGAEADAQDLPYPDDSFDLVAANHMLYHVPNPGQAVGEIARVVRPGGAVMAATNGFGHMDVVHEVIDEVFGTSGWIELYKVFGIESGERLLREQFRTVSWHAYDNDLLVTDLSAAVAYLLSYPPGDTATEVQQAAVAAAFQRRTVDGTLRIRTRTGVFICHDPR